MDIRPLNRVALDDPIASADGGLMRQLVAAISALNRPELLDRGREFKLRRSRGNRRTMVDLVDLETGEILDQLPPDEVLRMMDELEKEREGDL